MEVHEYKQAWMDMGDDFEYSHTTVILRRGDEFFYARTIRRYRSSSEISSHDLDLHPIPAADIWPVFSTDLTRAPDPLPADCYVKRPSLLHYADMTFRSQLSNLLLQEARTCELLRKNPHPNIAQYLGCIIHNNRITGLCFVRYSMTLAHGLNDNAHPLQREIILNGIALGIEHLHGLGIIHNDVNPSNIMLKSDDTPVIIDFDSSLREGEKLGSKAGTRGWTDENFKFASRTNDYYGMKKIQEVMELPAAASTSK
jgi:serine/threonine protein kinase